MIKNVKRVAIMSGLAGALIAGLVGTGPAAAYSFEARGGCSSTSTPLLNGSDPGSGTTYIGVEDDQVSWVKNTSSTKFNARNVLIGGVEETLFAIGGSATKILELCGQDKFNDKTDHFRKA
ncbi:MAG: hypothetical protein L0G99_09825 [Propionibacteriales bacterium]|nr:hypothetical protein [Propionibacteriales bacterium]